MANKWFVVITLVEFIALIRVSKLGEVVQVFGSLPACRYGHDLPFVEAIKQRSDTGSKIYIVHFQWVAAGM